MDTSILEDLGLTGAEIKIFVTLLELGATSAGRVVEKSGLQNAVVHRAFHSLMQKGLITYVFNGKIKQYQSIEPKLLLSFLDEKKEKLEKLLPELEAKRTHQIEKPKATIFEGQRGIKELLSLLIDAKSKEYLSYGGAQKSDEILGTYFWESFHKKRIKKRIKAKLLFHASLKWWGDELKKMPLTKVRTTQENFEELTETIICENKIGIIVWLDKPFGFLIEEPLASKSYKKFFDLLWGK
jgi:predicted transcriptional regulator